uniref:CBM21 domain-containing protein n=1 Tax=Syphacia muris TaxID=451379 RepID=A0A0N5APC5_9BILA
MRNCRGKQQSLQLLKYMYIYIYLDLHVIRFVYSFSCERSVSLSSALKKPNSRNNKKVVHFADSLGLDLVHVLPFVSLCDPNDEIFGTTPPLLIHGFHQRSYITPVKPSPTRKVSTITPPFSTYLHPLFTALGGFSWQDTRKPNERLIAKTRANGVCLKSIETRGSNITGTIIVVNYNYRKEVYVRYTLDNWNSYIEVAGMYINGNVTENIDMFSFSLFLPQSLPVGVNCEFCLRYKCDGKEYWDNNDGHNYSVEVRSLNFTEGDEDEGIFESPYSHRKWL